MKFLIDKIKLVLRKHIVQLTIAYAEKCSYEICDYWKRENICMFHRLQKSLWFCLVHEIGGKIKHSFLLYREQETIIPLLCTRLCVKEKWGKQIYSVGCRLNYDPKRLNQPTFTISRTNSQTKLVVGSNESEYALSY